MKMNSLFIKIRKNKFKKKIRYYNKAFNLNKYNNNNKKHKYKTK